MATTKIDYNMEDNKFEIRTRCPLCTRPNPVITLTRTEYDRWHNRELHIQDAAPRLSPDEREALLTGICPTCWEAMNDELE
jgi:hypothetical protein